MNDRCDTLHIPLLNNTQGKIKNTQPGIGQYLLTVQQYHKFVHTLFKKKNLTKPLCLVTESTSRARMFFFIFFRQMLLEQSFMSYSQLMYMVFYALFCQATSERFTQKQKATTAWDQINRWTKFITLSLTQGCQSGFFWFLRGGEGKFSSRAKLPGHFGLSQMWRIGFTKLRELLMTKLFILEKQC